MSITQVLTNLSSARGGIVSALSGRGMDVSSDTTLTSAAVIISSMPMSGAVVVSDTTADSSNVESGYTFYDSNGNKVSGTLEVTSGGIDVSNTTATSASVLSGAVFHDSTGTLVSGNIPTVTATLSANSAVVPSGYIGTSQTLIVPEAAAVSVVGNEVTIPAGYNASSQTVSVGSAVSSQTITPGTSATVLSSGGYLAGDVTIEGDVELVGSNILSGVSIFGVSGTLQISSGGVDVSDTTAVPDAVLSGAAFYDSTGTKVSGTMPWITSQTITPGTSAQVISGGQYISGDQTIAGDAALVGSNIASGVSIFGVSGTLAGGSTDFYKCATVDSTNHTWTGYKAVLNQSGYYEFESTATTGLTYDPITPVVDLCYTDGALLLIEPYDPGIIPVDANTMFLLQGSLHDKSGHVADSAIVNHGITIVNGNLSCANNGYAVINANTLPSSVLCDNHDWTLEVEVDISAISSNGTIFGRGDYPRADLTAQPSNGIIFFNAGEMVYKFTSLVGEHNIKLTHTTQNVFSIYVDGVAGDQNGKVMSDRNLRETDLGIGYDLYYYYFNNTIKWLRISDCIR